jgi:hypothetical protein
MTMTLGATGEVAFARGATLKPRGGMMMRLRR